MRLGATALMPLALLANMVARNIAHDAEQVGLTFDAAMDRYDCKRWRSSTPTTGDRPHWTGPHDIATGGMVTSTRRSQVSRAVAERRAEVLALRAEGWTFAAIGARLGVNHQRASKIHSEGLAMIVSPSAEAVRARHDHLRDLAVRDLLSIAQDPEQSGRTRAEAWRTLATWVELDVRTHGAAKPMPADLPAEDDAPVQPSGLLLLVQRSRAEAAPTPSRALPPGIIVDAPESGPGSPVAG